MLTRALAAEAWIHSAPKAKNDITKTSVVTAKIAMSVHVTIVITLGVCAMISGHMVKLLRGEWHVSENGRENTDAQPSRHLLPAAFALRCPAYHNADQV